MIGIRVFFNQEMQVKCNVIINIIKKQILQLTADVSTSL